jgi:ABC-type Fe3+/spermidine/putrescine transport system ATPase subunit
VNASLPMVRLEGISKRYAGTAHPAVADLSLEIPQGEIFTLLGPSGCGKTTTLRIVAGLEMPDSGALFFEERPIVAVSQRLFVPAHKRNVGMVFQSYAIWPHMTVEENVAYPLKLRRVPRTEMRERVERALGLVGLTGLEKRPAPFLSGGQQQRVALARALVYEPSLLLLDEPFSNLDTKLREQMRIEVKLLQARLRVTVLFVTHDQVEALSLSNRIALMDAGRVQQVGSPRDLYERPANTFVRDFLGKTVLLRGVVQATNAAGQVAVGVDGAPECVVFGRSYAPEGVHVGTPVFLAMRPEDAEVVAADDPRGGAGTVRGLVEAALFVGERTEYRVQVHDQGSVLVYGKRTEVFGEGQEVRLHIHPESVSVWPA